MSLMFGTADCPTSNALLHCARCEDSSQFGHHATAFIGFFYLLTILGFGRCQGQDDIKRIDPGGNMAAPMLAEILRQCLLGLHRCGFLRHPGSCSWANASEQQLCPMTYECGAWRSCQRIREQLKVARGATLSLAIILGIFKGQNVAYMVGGVCDRRVPISSPAALDALAALHNQRRGGEYGAGHTGIGTDLSLQLFRSTSSSIPQRFSLLRTQGWLLSRFPLLWDSLASGS